MNEPRFILLTVVGLISVGWLLALTSCSPTGVGVRSLTDPDLRILSGTPAAQALPSSYQAPGPPCSQDGGLGAPLTHQPAHSIHRRDLALSKSPAHHFVQSLDANFAPTNDVCAKGLSCWPRWMHDAINSNKGFGRPSLPIQRMYKGLLEGISFGTILSLIEQNQFRVESGPPMPRRSVHFDG